jgi:hypothetical protein
MEDGFPDIAADIIEQCTGTREADTGFIHEPGFPGSSTLFERPADNTGRSIMMPHFRQGLDPSSSAAPFRWLSPILQKFT